MEIRPVEAESFPTGGHMDGRTDRLRDRLTDRHDEAKSLISQFCEST